MLVVRMFARDESIKSIKKRKKKIVVSNQHRERRKKSGVAEVSEYRNFGQWQK